MTEVAEDFNDADLTLADGTAVGVDLRSIASGTGYQFIARGQDLPPGLHAVEPAVDRDGRRSSQPMTEVRPQTVPNVAGIVMKDDTADELRATYGELTAANPRRCRDRR